MLKLLTLAELRKATDPDAGVNVVIVGGGATGVELAAELREASSIHANYGFRRLNPHRDVRLTLLEGAPRILAPLPERVSKSAARLLADRAVGMVTNCRVTRIEADRVVDATGQEYPADLCVWAAGIRAPSFLANMGLPTNKSGQIEVDGSLKVVGQDAVYALGDCAACPGPDGRLVPPRAQSAHQQADYLFEALMCSVKGKPAPAKHYVYHDHGSLVSIGTQSSVGNLMGALRATWFVEGMFARWLYVSLHLMHHQAVLGSLRTGVLAVARFLVRRARPLVKLH